MLKGSPKNAVQQFNENIIHSLSGIASFFDTNALLLQMGLKKSYDMKLYCAAKVRFSLKFNYLLSSNIFDFILRLRNGAKKCLVLDLDNTLWGGVIGDDGIDNIKVGMDKGPLGEAFLYFQNYLKSLKNRGILLAVCSKNEEEIAKAPF